MMSKSGFTDLALMRRVLNQAKGFWRYSTVLFLIDLLATPLGLLAPLPLKIAVDSVIGTAPLPEIVAPMVPNSVTGSNSRLLVFVVILQILAVLFIQLQSLLSYSLRTKVGEGMTLNFRARLFHQAQRLSLVFHDTRGTMDSIYRIQHDAPSIQWLTIYGLMPLLSSSVMLLAMVYVILRLNLHLAFVALTILPLLYLYSHFYTRRMRPRYKETKQLESNALKVIQEVLTAIRVVKVFGREQDEDERFKDHSRKNAEAKIRLAFAEGEFGLVVNLTTALGSAAVLFIGVLNVQSGSLTVGELLMIITYIGQLYTPVKNISNKVKGMQSALAGVQRAFELLDEMPEVVEKPHPLTIDRAEGTIEFRNVTFAYPGEKPVLKRICFSVRPGIRIGIQGRTGAGKSTLLSLLYRLYDPQEGHILLDGTDIREYKLADLRRQFAIMLQEPMLFSTSITENIAYASPGADFQEIMVATKAANAHDFIVNLDDGYDTLVGERGMRLSGGERQRISLARAFLRDSPVLILDEPTSSVDMATETGIMEAMERLIKGRTCFIIAHRLNTLENCHQLMRFEDGRLVSMTENVPKAVKRGRVVVEGRR
jgi:ATP-binding cassette subfamily B protein